ncbi:MAG: DUF4249 domain-containing protein [Cyclobacteriaceae bacterium]
MKRMIEINTVNTLKHVPCLLFPCLLVMLLFNSCIDPLDLDNTGGEQKIVVYGYIHNEAPPYTVEVSKSQIYTGGLNGNITISNAVVTLHEEGGNTETLTETTPGQYQTCDQQIQGTPGKAYWVTILLPSGESYRSEREVMPQPPTITEITTEPTTQDMIGEGGFVFSQDVLTVMVSFIENPDTDDQYFIKYKGTYQVTTNPESATRGAGGVLIVPAPEPCSGYIYNEDQGLVQVEECTCCDCWVTEEINDPILLDDQRFGGNNINKLEVVNVPVRSFGKRTGYNYWIGVEVRSMTRSAWDYWDALFKQKNGNGTIFQPPPSPLPGNIVSENGGTPALGFFYAASRDLSGFPGLDKIKMNNLSNKQGQNFSCLRYDNSVNVKPEYYPF